MAEYRNVETGAYEDAQTHFEYRFEHTTETRIESLEEFMALVGADEDEMEELKELHIIELDYETGDWHCNDDADVYTALDYLREREMLDPDKYDDRYYNDDDEEEEDEQEEEDEYEVISSFIKSMDPETRDEWRFGDGRIDITIDDDPTHWSFVFWRLPFPYDHYDDIIYGFGAARYLDDILGEEYDASPLDIETTIATARIRDILQDYEDIRRGRPWRKSVHEMAVTWAAAIGGELRHETDTPSTMEHASGELGHHHIEVIYHEIGGESNGR